MSKTFWTFVAGINFTTLSKEGKWRIFFFFYLSQVCIVLLGNNTKSQWHLVTFVIHLLFVWNIQVTRKKLENRDSNQQHRKSLSKYLWFEVYCEKYFLSDLLEGDIVLDGQTSRASVNKPIYLWPGGIVPYVLESSLSTYIFVCQFWKQYILV